MLPSLSTKQAKATCEPSLVSHPLPERAISHAVVTRESIPEPLRLSLSGPTAAHDATLAVRDFGVGAAMDESDVSRLAIVVEELVTNLYDHGGLKLDDIFTIELSITGDEVSLVLVDPGEPFDPRSAGFDRTIPQRGGGAGLKLVRTWATSIEYEIRDGLNRLSVRLPRG